ncbi:MAG: NAD-dependent epimerase/dehydratase family protein [Candidatus Aminicenantales bacterium]
MRTSGRALVTGAGGFLGSLIAEGLVLRGYEVLGLDQVPPDGGVPQTAGYRFFKTDITRPETFPSEIRRSEILVHCAALVHRKSSDLSRSNYFRINRDGTRHILSALDPAFIKRVIFMSTVSVYGDTAMKQVPDEETRPRPVDPYGESKFAAEEEIRAFSNEHGVPCTIFRPAPAYGRGFLRNIRKRVCLPGQAAFYKIGDGSQRISMCAAGNVVEAVCQSLERGIGCDDVFNLKDSQDYSINDIIAVLRDFDGHPCRPVLKIPGALPSIAAAGLKLVQPEKGALLGRRIRKVAADAVFSGEKLFRAGINLPWNMSMELSGQTVGRGTS